MALSLCSARTSIAVGRPGTSRRTRPVVRSVGEDMLKIFSKPNDAPPGLGSEWSGAVTHHDAKRRPFNEGGKAKGTKIAGSASAGAAQVPQEPEEQSNEVIPSSDSSRSGAAPPLMPRAQPPMQEARAGVVAVAPGAPTQLTCRLLLLPQRLALPAARSWTMSGARWRALSATTL